MTRMLAVDERNDLYIANDGRLAVNRNLLAVMQAAQHAAQAQLGEMVLAVDEGVPNFQTVWRDAANVAQFEAYVRRAILAVEGVTEVREFGVVVRDNRVIYSATIVSIYGSGVLSNG